MLTHRIKLADYSGTIRAQEDERPGEGTKVLGQRSSDYLYDSVPRGSQEFQPQMGR